MTISLRERRPLPKEFWEPLGLTQVDLHKTRSYKTKDLKTPSDFGVSSVPTWSVAPPAHLSKLPLPQLLPEDQLLPWELGSGDVLPGERVHGEGGDGVHVAAGDALQAHDVRLSVVRRVAMETLVRRALGDVRLGVASATRCRRFVIGDYCEENMNLVLLETDFTEIY